MPERTYHHGDLRKALVEAGLKLLEDRGTGAVSLRAVAGKVGVSQAAPYAHFRDKRSLMSAIAAVGFARLHARLEEAGAGGADSLVKLGTAYLDFAVRNPGLYSLMFGQADEIDPFDEELTQTGRRAFDLLAKSSAPEGSEAQSDPGPIAAWALVHGLAMLTLNRKLPSEVAERPEAVLRTLELGIAAHLGRAAEPRADR